MREKGIDWCKKTVSLELLMGFDAMIDTSAITDVDNNLTLIDASCWIYFRQKNELRQHSGQIQKKNTIKYEEQYKINPNSRLKASYGKYEHNKRI